ncbi:MAG: septal ring lytic transglycosylase RlpA family protein [Gemmatimonas sp.]
MATVGRYIPRAICVAMLFLSACAVPHAPPPQQSRDQSTFRQEGIASWYGSRHHGLTTASGERFDMNAPTAAHKSLPFGTVVRVTNLDNGRTTKVKINDRGPYVRNRIIDLSSQAARALGMRERGIARVRIEAYASDQPGSQRNTQEAERAPGS